MSIFESNVVETAFGTKHLEDYITAVITSEGMVLLLHQDKLWKAPAMVLCCRIRYINNEGEGDPYRRGAKKVQEALCA